MIDRLADFWSSKKSKHTKFWRWLNALLTITMVAYLGYAFTKGGLRLNQIDWSTYSGAVMVVLGIYLLSLIIQFFVWTRMISFHRKVGWKDLEIYARMIMMRSLPGGAWHWVGRVSMYSVNTEVPTRIILLGNFLEWAIFTLCGAGIFFITLPVSGLGIPLAALSFCIALWLAFTWQPTFRKWITNLAEGSLWIVLYCITWVLAALILYLLVYAVAGPGKINGWESLHSWSFTGSLGMLVTMLPSSLGLREISLVWLLQTQLTSSMALLIAIMLRIIYTFADAIWGLIMWMISYLILRKGQSPH